MKKEREEDDPNLEQQTNHMSCCEAAPDTHFASFVPTLTEASQQDWSHNPTMIETDRPPRILPLPYHAHHLPS
jgi:hypothetical protein